MNHVAALTENRDMKICDPYWKHLGEILSFQFTERICKVYFNSKVACLNWLLPED